MKDKSVLYCLLAHQDDEVGIFSIIEKYKREGRKVVILYLTSGTFSGEVSKKRNQESLRVLEAFKVSREDCIFIGAEYKIPDGKLYLNLKKAFFAVKDVIYKRGDVVKFFFPAWEGGHHDHDASHLVGVSLCYYYNCSKESFQFPLYNAYNVPKPFFRMFKTLAQNGPTKEYYISWGARIRYLRHCLSYPSQAKTWIGLFPFVFFDYLFSGKQKLQQINVGRVYERPHKEDLYYENRSWCSWNSFCKERDSFIGFLKQKKFI